MYLTVVDQVASCGEFPAWAISAKGAGYRSGQDYSVVMLVWLAQALV